MILKLSDDTFIDTSKPLDISIALTNDDRNPRAWYVDPPKFEPVRTEYYVGSVKEGGSVNFRDIYFNPHGHCTHTECLGHITEEVHSINETLNNYFFNAQVISILPKRIERNNGDVDFVITADQLKKIDIKEKALIIRSLPNDRSKTSRNYSSSNPPYYDVECVDLLLKAGVEHLLIDLPSVDRENDNGELAFHHAFWEVPNNPNYKRTITELVYVDNAIKDGTYILNLQVASFNNDAAPSRPVLYEIKSS
jgi:kynurenine formamidase